MDLGASGWFDDPTLWKQVERLKPLDEALLHEPRPFRPEVAAVIDERRAWWAWPPTAMPSRGRSDVWPDFYSLAVGPGGGGAGIQPF